MKKKKDKYIICDYCGIEIHKSEATYVEGRPYCEDCYREAEIYMQLDDNNEEEDEDNNDNDEDDDD